MSQTRYVQKGESFMTDELPLETVDRKTMDTEKKISLRSQKAKLPSSQSQRYLLCQQASQGSQKASLAFSFKAEKESEDVRLRDAK